MVIKVLSKYGDQPPTDLNPNRKIKTEIPLNPQKEVLSILSRNKPAAMTRKSNTDLQRLSLDLEDLGDLIEEAVKYGKYRDSEWCQSNSGNIWFACDSYELRKKEYIENAYKEIDVNYFLKFCINKNGDVVCTFSCHLSS